jgi:hypothetical protein
MTCGECLFFKKDLEYTGLGTCQNDEATDKIILGHVDMFLFSEEFGCIFAAPAEQLRANDQTRAV